MDGILNRLHVAVPSPRDNKARPPVIPPSVALKKQQQAERESRKRKLEREIELEQGDDYVLGELIKRLLVGHLWLLDTELQLVTMSLLATSH